MIGLAAMGLFKGDESGFNVGRGSAHVDGIVRVARGYGLEKGIVLGLG